MPIGCPTSLLVERAVVASSPWFTPWRGGVAHVAIGIALGYAAPQLAISLKPFGDAFIKAIKLMVAPIVLRGHCHDGRYPSRRLRRTQGDHLF
jgi:hypothetical protein